MAVSRIGVRTWLARREGETPAQQMERIRQTCRWCGEFFGRKQGVGSIELRRHEMGHINNGDG